MNSMQEAMCRNLLLKHMGYTKKELRIMDSRKVEEAVVKCWKYSPHTYKVSRYKGDWLPCMGGRQYFRNKLIDGMSSTE